MILRVFDYLRVIKTDNSAIESSYSMQAPWLEGDPSHLSWRMYKLNEIYAAWAVKEILIETKLNENIKKWKSFTEPFFNNSKKTVLHILHLKD